MTDRVGVNDGKHVVHTIMANNSTSMHGTATVSDAIAGRKTPLEQQKTKSEPSTPLHYPQSTASQRRSPATSNPTRDGSPRSLKSDQSQTPAITRRPMRGCKFETGMAQARRRVPYSLGPDKLAPEPSALKKQLGAAESKKLTADMQELYEQLLPSPESEDRRTKFVNKLEKLLQSRWPGTNIKVRVFGSTGNRLGTSDSDVDICITTDCKEIENVCLIAELLEKNGLQRIVCVSSAKIPIVKAWDPEFQVACDMNVNNPIALENTHMIRSYVLIDERVRPLAMIIKYWAKKRTLNDAGKFSQRSRWFPLLTDSSTWWHTQFVHLDLFGPQLSTNTTASNPSSSTAETGSPTHSTGRHQHRLRQGYTSLQGLRLRE